MADEPGPTISPKTVLTVLVGTILALAAMCSATLIVVFK